MMTDNIIDNIYNRLNFKVGKVTSAICSRQ